MRAEPRRSLSGGSNESMIYRFAGLSLDIASRLLSDARGPIDVPRRVFDCLCYLVEHRDRAVGRDELIRHVWGRENVSDTQLAQIVLRARRVVGDDGVEQKMIRTVAGFGFHWIGAIDGIASEIQVAHAGDLGAPAPTFDEPNSPKDEDRELPRVDDSDEHLIAATNDPLLIKKKPKANWRFAILAMLLGALGFAFWTSRPTEHPVPSPETDSASHLRALILPARVEAADHIDWARLGLMDLIAGRLRDSGLAVPPSENVLTLLNGAQTDQPTDVEHLRQRAQVGLVVRASVLRLSSGWQVGLEGWRDNGLSLRVEGQHTDLIEAGVRASDALLVALDRRPRTNEEHPSVEQQEIRAALLGNELDLARRLLSKLPDPQRKSRDANYLSAELDFRAGRHAEARAALDQLLLDASTDVDPGFRGRALVARASISLRLGDYAASDHDFLEACELLEGTDARRDLGRAVMGRGIGAMRLHDDERARSEFGRARLLMQSAGDDLGVARAAYNFAALDSRRGQIMQAIPLLEAAVQTFENYGSVNELSKSLSGLVDLKSSLLRWSEALEQSDRALALLPRLVDPQMQATVKISRASVMFGLGRLTESKQLLDEVDLKKLPANCGECLRARLLAAQLFWQRGEMRQTMSAADDVLVVARDGFSEGVRDRAVLLKIQAGIGLQSSGQDVGNFWPASWEPILDSTSVSSMLRVAYAYRQLQEGQSVEAEQTLRAALRQAEAGNDFESMVIASQILAEILLKENRVEDASALIGQLSVVAEHDYEGALLLLRVHHQIGEPRSWSRALERARALAGERTLPPNLTRLAPG